MSLLSGWLIVGGYFPVAYLEETGLAPFKIIIEWVIIALLWLAALHLYLRRKLMTRRTLRLFTAAIALTICAELVFTSYISVYDLSNLIGQ